jgi:hypothetical protein
MNKEAIIMKGGEMNSREQELIKLTKKVLPITRFCSSIREKPKKDK